MRSVVLYAPHLGRDIRTLQEAVPDLITHVGLPTPRGEDGCLESHKAVIREAKELGEPRVFVTEDDCQFTDQFNLATWNADADWAEANGYDVMAGGCTRTYDEKVVRLYHDVIDVTQPEDKVERFEVGSQLRRMIEVSAFHSAHCVVYFASGYEKALKAVQPYDWSLGRDCGMRCVLVHPFVAVQRPSYSGILRQLVDYVPYYQQHEAVLGRL